MTLAGLAAFDDVAVNVVFCEGNSYISVMGARVFFYLLF